MNIPHHSFANPAVIGKAVVTVASGTFKERNEFQIWHKNTLHVGLTVQRDKDETITSSTPYFHNFQYDGKTDWGDEEAIIDEGYAALMAKIDTMSGMTRFEAWALDIAMLQGLITESEAASYNSTSVKNLLALMGGHPEDFIGEIQRQSGWSTEAIEAAFDEHQSARPGSRRRLLQHDEWGGVQYKLRLSKFAEVYTVGSGPTWYDVAANVGGASGTLVGLLAFVVIVSEVFSGDGGSKVYAGGGEP